MNPPWASNSRAHYEALRQRAVDHRQVFPTDPLGAIVVFKTGVAGWLWQWRRVTGEIIAAPSGPAPFSRPPNEPGWQRDLALLLAQMSAPHLRSSRSL